MITIHEVATHLDKDGYHYDLHEDQQYLNSTFRGPQGNFRLVIRVASEGARVLFLVPEFDYVRDERRLAALETLMQLNYELIWGGFAVDLRDGEVIFQVGASTEGVGFPYELYADMMGLIHYISSTYRDVLKMVIFGKMEPVAAIAACEEAADSNPSPPPNGTRAAR
ncbi:MAG: YbjN domain-containing protein [Chloroflexota bacterium]